MNCPECKHELIRVGHDRLEIGYNFFKVCPRCWCKYKTLAVRDEPEVIQFKMKTHRPTKFEIIAQQIKDAGEVEAFRRDYLSKPISWLADKYNLPQKKVATVAGLLQIKRRRGNPNVKCKAKDEPRPRGCDKCKLLAYCSENHAGGVGILPCEVSCSLDENPALYDASPGLNMTRPISVEIELRIAA